jgi:AcrR family transcriptional regulator
MKPPAPAEPPSGRRERADGRRSRAAILDTAARLATIDGLEGLSIGNLAERTGMSKSGLYAHFRSKEQLQLATIDRAAEIFDSEVRGPARSAGAGLPRLWSLCDEFLAHLERGVFPGGCFFAAVGAEFTTHPGRVKERIVAFYDGWIAELLEAATAAQTAGDIATDPDPDQLVFELDALLLMAHTAYATSADPANIERARRGLERLLGPRPARTL